MQDSSDHKYETTSNGDGGYSFTSSDDRPITPGAVSVGAGKDGFTAAAVTVQARGGQDGERPAGPQGHRRRHAVGHAVRDGRRERGTARRGGDRGATTRRRAGADTDAAANSSDSGSGSLLFIILGGLLVAAGVGAIVLVLMRRKGNDDEDDELGGPNGVVPPSQGRYNDATRVAAPVGGRPNDATMVAGMPGAPSMSDAPTMLQRPIPADEEFPDPYGAPAAAAGGVRRDVRRRRTDAGRRAGPGRVRRRVRRSGDPVRPPGAATTSTRGTASRRSVAARRRQRYDEPTGMYRPEPEYEQPADTTPVATGRSRRAPAATRAALTDSRPSRAATASSRSLSRARLWLMGRSGRRGRLRTVRHRAAALMAAAGSGSGGGAYGGGAPASGGGPTAAGLRRRQRGAYGAPAGNGTYGAAPGGYEVPSQRSGTYGGAPRATATRRRTATTGAGEVATRAATTRGRPTAGRMATSSRRAAVASRAPMAARPVTTRVAMSRAVTTRAGMTSRAAGATAARGVRSRRRRASGARSTGWTTDPRQSTEPVSQLGGRLLVCSPPRIHVSAAGPRSAHPFASAQPRWALLRDHSHQSQQSPAGSTCRCASREPSGALLR